MRLALTALLLVASSPALAGEGFRIESDRVAGFGLVADLQREDEALGVGHWRGETLTAGLAWNAAGWTVAASAGSFSYTVTGAGQGQGFTTTIALGYQIALAQAGTLSVSLRHALNWEAETRIDHTTARLGWSLRL